MKVQVTLEELTAPLIHNPDQKVIMEAVEKAQKIVYNQKGLFYINFCLSDPEGKSKYSLSFYKAILDRCEVDPTLVIDQNYDEEAKLFRTLIYNIKPEFDDRALELMQTIEALSGKELWSKIDVEKLFNLTVTCKKDKTFAYLLPRVNFDQRPDKDVLITLRDVTVGQLNVLLDMDTKRNFNVGMLHVLFQKITQAKMTATERDDLIIKMFDKYGYPQFGDEKESYMNQGRENFVIDMLKSGQFFPKAARVFLPADKPDCFRSFARYVLIPEYSNYFAKHQKELHELYCTHFKMSDSEFKKLFKIEEPTVAPVAATAPSVVSAPQPQVVSLDQITSLLIEEKSEKVIIAAIDKAQKIAFKNRGLVHINFCLSSNAEYNYTSGLYKKILSHCVVDPKLLTEDDYRLVETFIDYLIVGIKPEHEQPALDLIQMMVALFPDELWDTLKIEKLFDEAIRYKKDKTFAYLFPRMKFDQRDDNDVEVLKTLHNVTVEQLKMLLDKDVKRNLSVSMLQLLFDKIIKTAVADADDLIIKVFNKYGYPPFGDEKQPYVNIGRQNFIERMLYSGQFFPNLAAVLLPADKFDCRSTFAFMVLKNSTYFANHQKALREFFTTHYKMPEKEFNKLFKIVEPDVKSAASASAGTSSTRTTSLGVRTDLDHRSFAETTLGGMLLNPEDDKRGNKRLDEAFDDKDKPVDRRKYVPIESSEHSFWSSDYGSFLQHNIFKNIEGFGKRLDQTMADKVEAVRKDLMSAVITSYKDSLRQSSVTITEVMKEINDRLISKINNEVLSQEWVKKESKVLGFFKKLAGVLLAAIFLFLPLASKSYRSFFFNSAQAHVFTKVGMELEKQDKVLQRLLAW